MDACHFLDLLEGTGDTEDEEAIMVMSDEEESLAEAIGKAKVKKRANWGRVRRLALAKEARI